MTLIESVDVFKIYGNGTEALRGVSPKVEKGEFVFIVGSFGASKSTSLKLITCEEVSNSDEIIVNGRELSTVKRKDIPYVCRMMEMVFQDFRLIDRATVSDNVAFAMHVVRASQGKTKKRVPYILSPVELKEETNCRLKELSGGKQQRVGLVRALVNNSSMIIADEPTGNIDPALSFEIAGLLSEINHRGTTMLMVTYEHRLVRHFRRHVVEIHDGLIVADSCSLALGIPGEN